MLHAQGMVGLSAPSRILQLYELISRRFIASQMPEAQVVEVVLRFELEGFTHEVRAVVEIREPGFTVLLPLRVFPLPEGKVRVEKKRLAFLPLLPPYTQGTLIQMMKRRGIGGPSTYARIVQTLLDRRYVIERRGFLFPTRLGMEVYAYLKRRYPLYSDEAFTRMLEKK